MRRCEDYAAFVPYIDSSTFARKARSLKEKKNSYDEHIRRRSRNTARAMQRAKVKKILVLAQLTVSTMRSVEVGKYSVVYCFHNEINDPSTFWRYDQKERINPALSVMRGELQQTT